MNGPSDSELRERWIALLERAELTRKGNLPPGVGTQDQSRHLNRIEYEAIWREWEDLLDRRRAGTLTDQRNFKLLTDAIQNAVKIHGFLLRFSGRAFDSSDERAAFQWTVRLDEIEMIGDADEERWAKLYAPMREETRTLTFVLEHPGEFHWAKYPIGISWRIDTMVWAGPTRLKI